VLEAQLGLHPGDPYDPEEAARALGRLLAFRFIETAGPPDARFVEGRNEVDLSLPVTERPLVRSVRLEPRPAGRRAAFSASDLREGLRTRAGEPLIPADLEADRQTIRKKYVDEGHLTCEVTARTVAAGAGAVEVELVIEEGIRTRIRSLVIAGNLEVPRRHIVAVMETRPALFFALLRPGIFDPEKFARDAERVGELYRNRGYLEAVVTSEPPRFSRDFSQIDLTLNVEEGPRYQLSEVAFEGNGPGVPTELLARQTRTRTGRPYDGQGLEEDRRRLLRWYQERYDRVPRIEIRREYALDPDDRRVKAVFVIDEEAHLFTGRVEIEGNLRTRDRVIRSALTVVPGLPLTELAVQESARRVAGLGYFPPEKVLLTAPPAGETRDVQVRVEERRTGLLQVGGGASTGEGEIAYVSLTQPNFDLFAIPGHGRAWKDAFSGGGQFLQLEFLPGTRQSEFFLRFEEPYLYNSDHSLSVLGATQIFDRGAYDETRVRGEFALGRFWDSRHRLSTRLGWVLEDVGITGISPGSPPAVTSVHGHTFLSYPDLRLGYRDLTLDPWSGPAGFAAEARGDASAGATGSEASFLRTLLVADLYQPVSALINRVVSGEPLTEAAGMEHVLRLGARFGWMEGLEGREVPIFERFFLGGPRSVRGFDYRGLGPEESGVRVGGEAFAAGTVEYSFPVVIPQIRLVALLDVADLEPRLSGISGSRFRVAAGGGIRVRTYFQRQVIPFDLYWAVPITREREDEVQVFTFSLGFGF
jgi:outer membrane protein insertion porin family